MILKGICSYNQQRAETFYCDYHHPAISALAKNLVGSEKKPLNVVQRLFDFVQEKIVFGGDIWRIKASETLKKGYGACYNKNLLLVALLRKCGVPADLCANPMKRTFNRPAAYSGEIEHPVRRNPNGDSG